MPSNHLYAEYNAIGTYKLLASNLFAYLTLIEWMKTCPTIFYTRSEDKQILTVYIQIGNWLLDDFKDLLPDNIVLEKD